MKNFQSILVRAAVVVLPLLLTSVASAQASRTWVSGVGDDANPCSRTAPCKTFAGAISKTAASGEIDCLDPGGFGALTITKAITIDCNSGVGSVLVAGTNGIVVFAGASDVVTIRNLSMDGLGSGINGISFQAGKSLHVVNVTIFGFATAGISVTTSSAAQLTVDNVTISECGIGIFLNPGSSIITDIAHARLWNNSNGVQALGAATNASIRDSSIAMNTYGVVQSGATSAGTMLVVSSQFTANVIAVQANTASNISVFSSTFGQNGTVFNPNGGAIFTDLQNLPAPGNGVIGTANGGAVTKI